MPNQLSPRERLAQHMEERRLDLDMRWADVARLAKVTTETLRQARQGEGEIRPTTRRGIERALLWEAGSVKAILAGGEPTAEAPIRVTRELPPAVPDQREELRRLIDRVPDPDLGRVHGYITGIVEQE